MGQDSLIPVVIVGAVDHGKSTFIGRLLVDTGQLTPDRLEDLESTSRELQRPKEYAHVTDQFQEEREANITIDTTQTRFQVKGKTYLLIDAPGHREYLANMITGAARAHHAILMLDVNEGIQQQTEKHADILKLLGVSHLAVFLNKMDLVNFQKSIYEQHRAAIEKSLSSRGLRASAIVPLAAYHGDNVAKKSERMPWYLGLTAVEFISSCGHATADISSLPVRFPTQLMHGLDGQRLALGRLEEGTLRANDLLKIFPEGRSVRLNRIHIYGKSDVTTAEAGMCVGLEVDTPSLLSRGSVLMSGETAFTISKSLTTDVFWASSQSLKVGDEIYLECRTQSALCRISRIFDEETNKEIHQLGAGELGKVEAELKQPIYLEPHMKSEIFGRVVMNRNGETVGCGVVAKLA